MLGLLPRSKGAAAKHVFFAAELGLLSIFLEFIALFLLETKTLHKFMFINNHSDLVSVVAAEMSDHTEQTILKD